ncbi:hypothetical protein NPIL_202311 [Nephila pilipes]|uniref:Uncharacterized protein n=1 Tax=Nephila pilipes TaxID=299642 RepID=A0A8X6QRY2_NEPPI|nr:hypothetical protein NPIL_202311 [Nephila pilipes]
MGEGYISEVCRIFPTSESGTSSSSAVVRKLAVSLHQSILNGKSSSSAVVDRSWQRYYGADNACSDAVGTFYAKRPFLSARLCIICISAYSWFMQSAIMILIETDN